MIFDTIQPWWPVLGLFAAALLAPKLSRTGGVLPAAVWALVPFGGFLLYLSRASAVFGGDVWRQSLPWAPSTGFNWDVWVSPVGLLLALLVTGIGTLIVLYAAAYLKGSDRLGRFLCFLFLFAGAMLGIAVSENLLALFVFWELTSISSYLLIGHYHEQLESRKSALDALLVTAGGGVAFLAGALLLGEVGGSYLIGELVASRDVIQAHALYPGIFICVLLGAITKSAQFPFHFWLPGAMAAPAPVSAYLHSATMVKAGVFLIAILYPLLGGTALWHYSLMGFGVVTMTWAALVAIVQTDLKRLLAFSTVSALGTLMLLFGIQSTLAIKTAVAFFLVHALYKGALFMVAGALEKATGTREVSQLGGLFRSFPLLAIGAGIAALSMSGLPPFVGFIAKELLYEVKLEAPVFSTVLVVCALIANAANVLVALNVGILPFLGRSAASDSIKSRKPQGIGFWIGPLVLGAGSLLFGLFPGTFLNAPFTAMVGQISGLEYPVKLSLWHGFNFMLLLSAVTLVLGVALFLLRARLWQFGLFLKGRCGWNAVTMFRDGLAGFIRWSGWLTRTIQSGSLTNYLTVIFLLALVVISSAWVTSDYSLRFPEVGIFRLEVLVLGGILSTLGILLVRSTRRMTSVFLLGSIGFGIAAVFALYGAPDLAITQILVETLTLLLFALAIYNLPAMRRPDPVPPRGLGADLVSILVGIGFAVLTLKAFDVQLSESVAIDIAARSVPEGFGRNVVNVILVDFRALDTMGEITVLLIAALGVFGMLAMNPTKPKLGDYGPGEKPQERSPVLAASSRYTAPAMLVFSFYLLLRGHNEPGGGFIGGLVAAMGAILVHLAHSDRPLRLLLLKPGKLMVLGLAMAVLSGLPGLFLGGEYLTAWWGGSFSFPTVGKIKLGTPLVFDVGVYFVVAGVVLMLYQVMAGARRVRSSFVSRAH